MTTWLNLFSAFCWCPCASITFHVHIFPEGIYSLALTSAVLPWSYFLKEREKKSKPGLNYRHRHEWLLPPEAGGTRWSPAGSGVGGRGVVAVSGDHPQVAVVTLALTAGWPGTAHRQPWQCWHGKGRGDERWPPTEASSNGGGSQSWWGEAHAGHRPQSWN